MAIRQVGLVVGILGVGLVVACSSSSSSPVATTDAGHETADTGTVKHADAGKDTGAPKKDTGTPDLDADDSSDDAGDDAGGDGICNSGISTQNTACDTCLAGEAACCSAASACAADTECDSCVTNGGELDDGGTDPNCDSNAALTALNNSCSTSTGACATACAPPPVTNACDPVTNAGCTGTDSGCDAAADQSGDNLGYQCFPGPDNTVALCGSCDNVTTSCAPGLTCFFANDTVATGQCAQYCCTNADCGTGFCDLTLTVAGNGGGLCTTGPADGGTIATDGGTDGSTDAAAIDAAVSDGGAGSTLVCSGIPATPPSGGSCVTWTATDAGM